MADYRAPRYDSNEPTVPRKLTLPVSANEEINKVLAQQNVSLSKLVMDMVLSPNRAMSSAESRALAAELMATRDAMNALLWAVMKHGAPADQEFVDKAETLNDRLFNLTEDMVRR